MRTWSIPAGRIFGIELRLHFTFPLLLLFIWAMEAQKLGTPAAWRSVALTVLLFASVLAHELAHAMVATANGLHVRSILLLPIGGTTNIEDDVYRNPNPGRDMRIAAAGPLLNLLLAVFIGSFVFIFAPQVQLFHAPFLTASNLPRSFVWGNFFLGAFNLLPAYPLDGGRVLRAWWAAGSNYAIATRRAVTVGQIIAIVLIIIGARWDTWLMLLGAMIFLGAQLEDRNAVFQNVLESIRMDEVMLTDFATLSPADTLEDALHKAVHTLQEDFPVIRGCDMVGTISRQRIVETLRDSGNGYVQGAMNRIFQVAHRTESLASVLRRVGRSGLTLIPIVENERLIGIVTLQNLMHSIAMLAETRRLRHQDQQN
ncbi:MAG TPA: site-2 protease family protein [Candidatus Acidoferrales bacterium]|nr:site-2 protease family protein [Candidatus Acidoferrales bacterium]